MTNGRPALPEEPLPITPDAATNCISFDQSPFPTNVLVVLPVRKQAVLFGGATGYTGATIGALAQARIAPGGAWPCVFCVINDDPHNLQNGTLTATGGNVWFNGNVGLGPQGEIISNASTVTGAGGKLFLSGDISGSPVKFNKGSYSSRSPRIVDPLAATVLPFAEQANLTPGDRPVCGRTGNLRRFWWQYLCL